MVTDKLTCDITDVITNERTKSPFRLYLSLRIGGSSSTSYSTTWLKNGGRIRTITRPSSWKGRTRMRVGKEDGY